MIEDLTKTVGKTVTLHGWVETIRDQGSIIFLVFRDSTAKVQLVVPESSKAFETVRSLNIESVIEVTGSVKKEEQAPFGGVEVEVSELKILSLSDPELPIQVVEKNAEKPALPIRSDYRWIEMRKEKTALIYKVWTQLELAYVQACIEEGFIQIHSPKLMSTPSEGGSEFFEVKYFEKKAYLVQSPQFYKQMAQAAGFGGVFEIGPVFRAEPSFTSRHATEFTGYDFEFSYIESHFDVMEAEERIFVKMLTSVNDKFGKEIKELYGRELLIPKTPFPKLRMVELKEILKSLGTPSKSEHDISPDEEKTISLYVKKELGHEFVFITDYSIEVRPFYHMRYDEKPDVTKSFDLIWGGLEVTTGAQREHRVDILKKQATEKGVTHESISKYLEFFTYGCPPHGGAGLGADRIIMQIFGIKNIREASFLPRDPKRLEP